MNRMADLTQLAQEHQNLSEAKQKQAGQAIAGPMPDDHKDFVKRVSAMIKAGEIDYHVPDSMLNRAVYDALGEADRAQVDLTKLNVADQLRRVSDFYLSKQTPDESPQLKTMIEHLWQMKHRAEEKYGNVFKF